MNLPDIRIVKVALLAKMVRTLRSEVLYSPPHVTKGDISKIKKFVERQYALHRMGRPSAVVEVASARFGKEVTVAVNKFGVYTVGAYIMMGHIMSVYPEESNGGTFLKVGEEKVKKSKL